MVARVVASRWLMLTVASPVTVTPTQTGATPRSERQEVDTLVVGTTEVTSVGARVIAAEAPALTMAETPAATDAVASPPLVGRTPASRVTVARLPRPKVMQAFIAAPEHDSEVAVMVLPEMTTGVASRAGTVMAADATGKEAVAPTLTRPPLVGRTSAPTVTVARFPRPKVTQASTAPPEHDVESAVMVLPEIVSGVGSRAGTVTAADAMGKEALTPALARPPLVGRASAPRLTVPRGPRPRLTHTLRTPLPVHDCWMAVMASPPMTVLVGTTVMLVIAGVETGTLAPRETMLPSVFKAPRVTVVEGPTPSAKQSTLSQDAIVVVITSPPGRVVGTLAAGIEGMIPPAPTLMRLPSEFKAPRVTVAEGPTPSPRQRTPLHELVVPVTPGMLGIPVMIGVATGRPAPISMILPAGSKAPSVAVIDGPTPTAKQTAPLHWLEVAVKTPLGAEKVVGVAPALPPRPRLTVTPFPMPRVAHKSTNSPPQLVVVEVKVTPVGKVTPGGRMIPLVIGPTTLVMDAIALDCCDRMEEMEAVASL
jgi:hypothetical protein